jgi:hypothetical protein
MARASTEHPGLDTGALRALLGDGDGTDVALSIRADGAAALLPEAA